MTSNPSTYDYRRAISADLAREMLDKALNALQVGVEREGPAHTLVDTEKGTSVTNRAFHWFQDIGIIRKSVRRRGQKLGTSVFYTLLMPREEAMRVFEASAATRPTRGRRRSRRHADASPASNGASGNAVPATKPSTIRPTQTAQEATTLLNEVLDGLAVSDSEKEETKAIAGPEAPSPFEALRPLRKADDATALIEAARQYAARDSRVEASLREMRKTMAELGVVLDEEKVRAGLTLPAQDERLATIALVLPYIGELERKAERTGVDSFNASSLRTENAELRAQLTKVKVDNERLSAQVRRLVSERVGAAASAR